MAIFTVNHTLRIVIGSFLILLFGYAFSHDATPAYTLQPCELEGATILACKQKPPDFSVVPPWQVGESHEISNAYGTFRHAIANCQTHDKNTKDCFALDFAPQSSDADGQFTVTSIAQGKVRYAGWASGGYGPFGRIVDICHDVFIPSDEGMLEICSFYAHLSSIEVNTGDPVNQGEPIGTSGTSGCHDDGKTEAHLHFSIHAGSKYEDVSEPLKACFKEDGTAESGGVGPSGGFAVVPEPFDHCLKSGDRPTCEDLKAGVTLAHLEHPEPPPESPPESPNVDVMLIIDSSGSMTSNDPGNKRLTASRAYLTGSYDGDFVGVVDFDSTVRLASELKRLPDNKDTLIAAINSIDSSGGTNIGIGVQKGCDVLIASPSDNSNRAAILLTDGIGSFADQDTCFSSRGWPIYTFGLGDPANFDGELLGRIATNTGGEFLTLPPSSLICEFQRVRSMIADTEPPPCTAWTVGPLEFTRFSVRVESGELKATMSIDWIGSTVDMTLISPSGRVINGSTLAPDVEHDKGPTFEVFSMTNPEAGEWQVELFGADVPDEGEEVTFSLTTIPSPNLPPIADAKQDQVAECAGSDGTVLTLDGSSSTDPDGDPLTFAWSAPGVIFDDPTSSKPTATFPLGTTTATLVVTDLGGLTSTDTMAINVQDTINPTLTFTSNPSSLWPPNHQYIPVALSVVADDICDSSLKIEAKVHSSEPDDARGNGDGNTSGDIRVTTNSGSRLLSSNAAPKVALDPLNDKLELRAERSGSGKSRAYTITITATDHSGNQTTSTIGVIVPLNQRK